MHTHQKRSNRVALHQKNQVQSPAMQFSGESLSDYWISIRFNESFTRIFTDSLTVWQANESHSWHSDKMSVWMCV